MKPNDPKVLKELMKILSKHKKHCCFETKGETRLSDIFSLIPKDLNNYGVYIIIDPNNDEIVYIGESGKLRQDGTLTNQSLADRIMQGTKKQGWLKGKNYRICWFVTIERATLKYPVNPANLPSVVECELLKTFYELTGSLPKNNRFF